MTVWVPSCVLPEPFEHNLALGLAAFQQRVDADGNWSRHTDGRIQDFSADREVQAENNPDHQR